MLVPADYPIKDLRLFSKENKPTIVRNIGREFLELGSVKVNLAFLIHLIKKGVNGIERAVYFFRQDKPFPVIRFHQSEINTKIDAVINSILEDIAIWVKNRSGWAIERVERVYLDFARF